MFISKQTRIDILNSIPDVLNSSDIYQMTLVKTITQTEEKNAFQKYETKAKAHLSCSKTLAQFILNTFGGIDFKIN